MRLLVDMNLSPTCVDLLTGAGFEASHRSTVGAMNAPDAAIMAYPLDEDFVVPTHDLDFGAILAATHGKKPSVCQLRADDVSPDTIGRQMLAALRQLQADLQEGALVTVDANRTRLRVLPLRTMDDASTQTPSKNWHARHKAADAGICIQAGTAWR